MHFLAVEHLWLLMTLPVIWQSYRWLLRRRKQLVLAYPGLSSVRRALAGTSPWRRHLPPLLLLLAVAAMIVAGARPTLEVLLPAVGRTVVLAIDVSGSMRATDVLPNRLAAAQAAAKEFIRKLPESARIAVVVYAGTAHLVQAPTRSRESLFAAIDAFQLQRATAIGDGIVVSLGTIFPLEGISVAGMTAQLSGAGREHSDRLTGAEIGSHRAAAIVLLSDGQNTSGINPVDAARFAARRGVRVYTVGFGTEAGAAIELYGWSARVQLDEPMLKRIAAITGGTYYRATDAAELQDVYGELRNELTLEKQQREISSWFADLALALTLLSAALSVLWFGRIA